MTFSASNIFPYKLPWQIARILEVQWCNRKLNSFLPLDKAVYTGGIEAQRRISSCGFVYLTDIDSINGSSLSSKNNPKISKQARAPLTFNKPYNILFRRLKNWY